MEKPDPGDMIQQMLNATVMLADMVGTYFTALRNNAVPEEIAGNLAMSMQISTLSTLYAPNLNESGSEPPAAER